MRKSLYKLSICVISVLLGGTYVFSSPKDERRTLRYTPDGEDFIIVNGDKKFNRALYGGHSAFRIETGDVPEFAFYLPRMGGNLTFAVLVGKDTLQLNDASRIECRYRPGMRLYHITDPLLKQGTIEIATLASMDQDAGIWKISVSGLPSGTALLWRYGGVGNVRFSREGDMGVDKEDCFYLKSEYCVDNRYKVKNNRFEVMSQKNKNGQQTIRGIFPKEARMQVRNLEDNTLFAAGRDKYPVLTGMCALESGKAKEYYLMIGLDVVSSAKQLAGAFNKAELQRKELAGRVKFKTPDPYFNTIGGALAVAADGIWDGQVWLHGAIGWRMPLSGWRAAYTGDVLGWHDRARTHFDNYAASQVTDVPPAYPHPMQDSALNLARSLKKWGTPMYSNGYICRNPNRNNQMHHYDMNLCYMDELMWHLNWTGDWDYARKIWPVIERHLAWEKRNFDPDDDALYDAYCCIWASDALYYSGGAVTHSSAYNYRANKLAARIAQGLDMPDKAAQYDREARRIYQAINDRLWLSDKGVWAETQDLMGLGRLHTSPAVWTVYHAIDSEVGDPLQRYLATCYIDREIPHIPVEADGLDARADGLGFTNYATISTTNWQPYAWSINNVAFAEVMHTALAYWLAGRNEEAYHLMKSSMLDGMYLGGSPGNFGQISYYDVARAECYRDFGDPVGVASRAYIQGLYGVLPDRLNGKLLIRPGFPKTWAHAELSIPDLSYTFNREGDTDSYNCTLSSSFGLDTLLLHVRAYRDNLATVRANGNPVAWSVLPQSVAYPMIEIKVPFKGVSSSMIEITWSGDSLSRESCTLINKPGYTVCNKGVMNWIEPDLASYTNDIFHLGSIVPGDFTQVEPKNLEPVSLAAHLNDSLINLFEPRYFSPRPPYTTLQIPIQGIGEWCHPKTTFDLDDSALRKADTLKTSLGVNFLTPVQGNNVMFTTRWDNFPTKVEIPLEGKASHIYLLMGGSTNAMQSRIENAVVRIIYLDGVADSLFLVNPETWCPIEQDYYNDGLAFNLRAPRPYRLHLKTGLISRTLSSELERARTSTAATVDLNSTGIFGNALEGGAAILLDLPIDAGKYLKSIEVETLSNDVVVGLVALTLQRTAD